MASILIVNICEEIDDTIAPSTTADTEDDSIELEEKFAAGDVAPPTNIIANTKEEEKAALVVIAPVATAAATKKIRDRYLPPRTILVSDKTMQNVSAMTVFSPGGSGGSRRRILAMRQPSQMVLQEPNHWNENGWKKKSKNHDYPPTTARTHASPSKAFLPQEKDNWNQKMKNSNVSPKGLCLFFCWPSIWRRS